VWEKVESLPEAVKSAWIREEKANDHFGLSGGGTHAGARSLCRRIPRHRRVPRPPRWHRWALLLALPSEKNDHLGDATKKLASVMEALKTWISEHF